jgi:hypothetical protein
MIFSEKVRPAHLLRKNHPLNQQYLNMYLVIDEAQQEL